MSKQGELIAYLFTGRPGRLSAELAQWMDSSARFAAFVDTYRDKIRKKIRAAPDPESALDLRAELEVACALLADRRFEVVYEPYASAKRRGPDFAVTYRANTVFNLEVARIRAEADLGEADLPRIEEHVLRVVLNKLGQMQPGMPNLLALHAGPALSQAIDLQRLLQTVKTRAEHRDPAFYALSAYSSPAAFYKDFLRLSAVLLWAAPAQVWVNKQAKPGVDEKILRVLREILDFRLGRGE